MKASDLFVRCLEAEGVEYIFGVPGEENLDMLNSLRNSTIKLVLTRHEQAAGFMAATYGRLTGKAGVCMSTLGPGATNFVTAAAYANLGAMPMMMITGQKPIKQSKQGQFQILDIVDTMQPLTKFTRQIPSGEKIPSLVREAFRMAEEERPGAVHLEFPEDVAAEQTYAEVILPNRVRRPIAEAKAINCAVELLEKARSPLILIGAGANRKMTSRMLRQFIDETGIPFFTTQMGEGVVDEEHPLFIGNAALSANDFLHRAIDHADLIVNVGHDVVEKPPFFMRHGGSQVIHVNFSSAIVDDVYFPQVEVVGDIANSVWQIKEAITPQNHWDFEFFLTVRERIAAHIAQYAADAAFPMRPARIVADVRSVLPSDGIVCLDNGVYKIWFSRNYLAKAPNTLLLDNALATMGAGLPSAMAAHLVKPDKRVLAVCGDGGFMMNSQEAETAVRLNMHIVVLILRDDAYGMIKWKQADMGFENFGLDYGNPDFVKYAEAYGARGHRVERSTDLVDLLESCFTEHAVHVIDLPVDYSENDRILNREIRDLSLQLTP
jgi:acetolactate synthase-1/2/3 large subunit